MFPLVSRTYVSGNDLVFWQVRGVEYDFTATEFDELTAYLKEGRLFNYLEQNRPTLKDRLLAAFAQELKEGVMDVAELEQILERAFLEGSLQIGMQH